ncbi:MAG: hypothetical protein OQJ81_13385 [Melioribacteraceae bacterium]|nr:hypothetical protein [Melioribacteraceae bacterium]
MKSILEIIELRSVIKNKQEVIKLIENVLENDLNQTNIEMKIYTHTSFVTDYSVHLYYQINDDKNIESNLGHELSTYLRDYGLVSHNVWIEKNRKKIK